MCVNYCGVSVWKEFVHKSTFVEYSEVRGGETRTPTSNEHYILNLARLPIPSLGHHYETTEFKSNTAKEATNL